MQELDFVWFKFSGTFCVTKGDVFTYWEANDIEFDPDTAEPTLEDFQSAAEFYAENESLEMDVERC